MSAIAPPHRTRGGNGIPWFAGAPALAFLLISAIGGSAQAGEFRAHNCSNAPDGEIEVKTFNSTDIHQLFPFSVVRIDAGASAALTCNTSRCSYIFSYPKIADAETRAARTGTPAEDMEHFQYPLPVQSSTVCFFPKYTATGELETRSPPILHVSDCSC
ncbi:hypothetical protein T8K17_22545 [Thalassobaculum sp. OXR-137]|uniref:hypothetical protein n=1 Tax=Thalassobaculum sp. OXR-137 TaxID=3100173 RepID=UPI002AC9A045|nr:hypothetical protein [Thalassobaculum sp. OXR-137]WPZ34006.1 hypothetical protein T8K17_22545 [Thalassobaculum sp. OXR-137]